MRINVAVFGLHSQHQYVKYLHERGLLGAFYYSHAWSTDAGSIGLPPALAHNLWLGLYLERGHRRLFGDRAIGRFTPLYSTVWQWQVVRHWRPCDALAMILHGDGRRPLARARRDGSLVVGIPVNAHPTHQIATLLPEYERLGVAEHLQPEPRTTLKLRELDQCDVICPPSHFIARTLKAHGVPREKIHVLHWPIDDANFHPAPTATDETFRVVCVGAIVPRKGHVHLLEAWRRLGLTDAELLLVGHLPGYMRAALAPYEGLFRHIENVPNAALPDVYRAASAMVLPTLEDGFGYVVPEAMACGTPVITTTAAGAADLVVEGETGFVVPPADAEALAERIDTLYRDRARGRAMGAAAAAAVSGRTWRDFADDLAGVIETGLAERGRAPAT